MTTLATLIARPATSPAASSATLISTLAARGVRLWMSGDRLEIASPPGELTPDDLAAIKAGKPDILAYLDGRPYDPAERTEGPGTPVLGGPWSPRALPWREALTRWPIDARERWGRLAEKLEHDGHDWHDAERIAFERVGGRVVTGMTVIRRDVSGDLPDGEYPAWVFDDGLAVRSDDARAVGQAGRVAHEEGEGVTLGPRLPPPALSIGRPDHPPEPDRPIESADAARPIVGVTRRAMKPCGSCGSAEGVMGPGKWWPGKADFHAARRTCAGCGKECGWWPKSEVPDGWPKEEEAGGKAGKQDRPAMPAAPTLFD